MSTSIEGISSRFKGAEYMPFINAMAVSVIGAGGIGSPLMLTLSKMNPALMNVFDFDRVELHNLGGQVFSIQQVDEYKVEATQHNVKYFSGYESYFCNDRFDEDSEVTPIMFMCVDNMEARRLAFQKWKEDAEENNWEWTIVVDGETWTFPYVMFDGRLSANSFDVYVIEEHSAEYHSLNQLELIPAGLIPANCTTKSNPEVGFLTGNLMVTAFRNWVQNAINVAEDFDRSKYPLYRFNMNLATFEVSIYKSIDDE